MASRGSTCPACGSAAEVLFQTRDYNRRVSEVTFRYAHCGACGLIYLRNPPHDLSPYYAGEYFQRPSRTRLERASRRESYQGGFIRRHVSPGNLVEVGAAWGTFALIASELGFGVTAIEMDAGSCAYLESELSVPTVCTSRPEGALPALPQSRAIVLWQTLEHLADPWAFLAAAQENLEEGGILVIATPNPESLGYRIMGSRWPHVDAPRHLWLFPIDQLSAWVEALGFDRIELSTSDLGARRWNRFAWQRFLANRMGSRWGQMVGLSVGWAIAVVMRPVEARRRNGSSYTVVFRKKGM